MATDADGSVTVWIGDLKEGDLAAVQSLWERYFERMTRLARSKLAGGRGGCVDGEDVALSAFDSFCRAATAGRYPRLDDRDDLWRSLMSITSRKVINARKHAARQKRGGSHQVFDEASLSPDADAPGPGLDGLAGSEPSPEFAAEVAEQCERLLDALAREPKGDQLRQIALWKLEGFTNEQISERLGCSLRTTAYRLEEIRTVWEREARR